jgi:hypothetical protein
MYMLRMSHEEVLYNIDWLGYESFSSSVAAAMRYVFSSVLQLKWRSSG